MSRVRQSQLTRLGWFEIPFFGRRRTCVVVGRPFNGVNFLVLLILPSVPASLDAAVATAVVRRHLINGREIDASQAERLGRSCLSIARSALSLARSAQAERDNEPCFLCVQPMFINL
ncbi:hypothetical protein EVAR_38097_1 [Eumeta japonica]|uniref:Uncharacterized protein n=1 Tax=Eumeta variegata TaxID=151549 RepID=A0A4C1W8D9_EUMVA|nr:hypothetical protein EVAR_38097_1 [Eumeta japonica]